MVPEPGNHDTVHFCLVLRYLIQTRIHQQKSPVGRRGWHVDAAWETGLEHLGKYLPASVFFLVHLAHHLSLSLDCVDVLKIPNTKDSMHQYQLPTSAIHLNSQLMVFPT